MWQIVVAESKAVNRQSVCTGCEDDVSMRLVMASCTDSNILETTKQTASDLLNLTRLIC